MQKLKWAVKEQQESLLSQYANEIKLLDDFLMPQIKDIPDKLEKAALRKEKEKAVVEITGTKLDQLGLPRGLVFKSPLLVQLVSELEKEGFVVRKDTYGIPRIPGHTRFVDYVYAVIVELPEL